MFMVQNATPAGKKALLFFLHAKIQRVCAGCKGLENTRLFIANRNGNIRADVRASGRAKRPAPRKATGYAREGGSTVAPRFAYAQAGGARMHTAAGMPGMWNHSPAAAFVARTWHRRMQLYRHWAAKLANTVARARARHAKSRRRGCICNAVLRARGRYKVVYCKSQREHPCGCPCQWTG